MRKFIAMALVACVGCATGDTADAVQANCTSPPVAPGTESSAGRPERGHAECPPANTARDRAVQAAYNAALAMGYVLDVNAIAVACDAGGLCSVLWVFDPSFPWWIHTRCTATLCLDGGVCHAGTDGREVCH